LGQLVEMRNVDTGQIFRRHADDRIGWPLPPPAFTAFATWVPIRIPPNSRGPEHGGNQSEGYLIAFCNRDRDARRQPRPVEKCPVGHTWFLDDFVAVRRPSYQRVPAAERTMRIDR